MKIEALKKFEKKNVPDLRVGDTIKVHSIVREGNKERVQIFEGLVIAIKHGKTLDGSFTVRKESYGIGVERIFPLHSPRVVKIERIKHSKVRRSKLYYMRELRGKNARLKEVSRDYAMWEEKEAEEELHKIAEEKAKEAEEAAAKKAAEDAELEAKAKALAGDRIVGEEKAEKVEPGSAEDEREESSSAIDTADEPNSENVEVAEEVIGKSEEAELAEK